MPHKSAIRLVAEPLMIAVVLALGVRAAVRIYSIPSASMRPALEIGDHIVVTPYRSSPPQRGHVIVFRSPLNPNEMLVKRIIAVPGDLIDTREGRVRIGEHFIAEPYVARQSSTGAIQAQIVPAASFFVMGDNRDESLDSRKWGAVPQQLIAGRARFVLWSSASSEADPANAATPSRRAGSGTARLNRIFKCIE